MSHQQWHDWISSNIGYEIQCPGLPIASDDGRTGEHSRQIELSFSGLNHPDTTAVDSAGNVYVADTGNNRVLRLAAGSTTPSQLPFTELNHPAGVMVDRAGNVYVADGHNNRVLKLSAGSSTPTPLPFAGLNDPTDVAVDVAGNVYVVDYRNKRVLKLSADSTLQTQLPFTFSGVGQPNVIAVDTAGNVYVSDEGNDRVLELLAGLAAPFCSAAWTAPKAWPWTRREMCTSSATKPTRSLNAGRLDCTERASLQRAQRSAVGGRSRPLRLNSSPTPSSNA
jgi:sugar lactone lactonase YvrE